MTAVVTSYGNQTVIIKHQLKLRLEVSKSKIVDS